MRTVQIVVIFCMLTPTCVSNARINPATDLEYLGAFRVSTNGEYETEALGVGIGFNPTGNGGAGTLLVVDSKHVTEFSIPVPKKTLVWSELNTSTIMQPRTDITDGLYTAETAASPPVDYLADVEWMQPMGSHVTPKLYWSIYYFYNTASEEYYSIGQSDTDFSLLNATGPWHPGPTPQTTYPGFASGKAGKYVFSIDQTWADQHVGGQSLVTGRTRLAGTYYGSRGPVMITTAPWTAGAAHTNITASTALLYYKSDAEMTGYAETDRWDDGVWAEGTVIFSGQKGTPGYCYQDTNNDCDDPCSEQKGYHNYPYTPMLLFYDKTDLEKSASGTMNPWDIQPYTTFIPPADQLFQPNTGCHFGYGGMTYDATEKTLYVVEAGAYSPTLGPLNAVHVYRVRASAGKRYRYLSISDN